MQWRMVGRRGRTASWTIVGDPAQSSWPVPAESAAARAEALEGKDLHEFHLSTNYRNSSEIYAHAAAYAERVGLDADLPTAVRSTGIEPIERHRGRRTSRQPPGEAVAEIAGQVGGTVGIVVPVARRSEVNAWLASWPEFAEDATRCPGGRRLLGRALGRGPDRRPHRSRHQGAGVRRHRRRAPAGDRGRVGHRPRHPLRRPHPRHPAADHPRADALPRDRYGSSCAMGRGLRLAPCLMLAPPGRHRRAPGARGVGDDPAFDAAPVTATRSAWSVGAAARSSRCSTSRSRRVSRSRGTSPTGCWPSRSARSRERGFEAHDDGTPLRRRRHRDRAGVLRRRDARRDRRHRHRVHRPGRLRDRRRDVRRGRRGDHPRRDRPGRGRQPRRSAATTAPGRRLGCRPRR